MIALFNHKEFKEIMSALTDLQSAVTSLTTGVNSLASAIAIALPEINPSPATGGATDAQITPITVTVGGIVTQLSSIVAQLNAATTAPATGVPDAPLLATPVNTAGIVTLQFSTEPGATSYNVKRGTAAGAETTVASATTPNFTEPTALPTGTYFYVVTAVNASGESKPSNEMTIVI